VGAYGRTTPERSACGGLPTARAALRGADFHVDDDVGVLEEAGLVQREQAENRRGSVAATARNQVRAREFVAGNLGERVDGVVEVVGRGVAVVPLVVLRLGPGAEVRAQVDDGVRGVLPRVDVLHRDAVGRRGEQHVHRFEVRRLGEPEVEAAEIRVDAADRLVRVLAAGRLGHRELRVAGEQAEQFAAREPARADDRSGRRRRVRVVCCRRRHQAVTSTWEAAFASSQSTTAAGTSTSVASFSALNSTVWLTSWTV